MKEWTDYDWEIALRIALTIIAFCLIVIGSAVLFGGAIASIIAGVAILAFVIMVD